MSDPTSPSHQFKDFHLAVNLLHAPKTLTGTGHYAHQLINSMVRLYPELQITGYCSPFNVESFRIRDAKKYKQTVWGRPWNNVMVRRMEEWLWLHSEVKKLKPTIFWGPSNFLPMKKVCPYIVSIHDMTFFRHPEFLPLIRRKYWHYWTKRTIKLADHIITVSEAAKEDIVKYGKTDPDSISVVHNGTSEAFYIAEDEEGRKKRKYKLRETYPQLPEKYIFFLGTLTSHKNVPRLVDAFAKAKRFDGCEDMALVMAGKQGSGYDQVADMIAQHRVERSVFELGYTPDDLLPALYENAHVHVLPSYTEGFGLPITEAMAAGTPTVAGNQGATAEVIGDAGITFDPKDTFQLRDVLISLWTDGKLWKDRQLQGIERAKLFRWDESAKKIMDIMQRYV